MCRAHVDGSIISCSVADIILVSHRAVSFNQMNTFIIHKLKAVFIYKSPVTVNCLANCTVIGGIKCYLNGCTGCK